MKNKYPFKVFSIGSIFWFAFTEKEKITSSAEIDPESMKLFRQFYHDLLEQGIYMGPSGYEVGFISQAHSEEVLETAAELFCSCLEEVYF